VGLTLLDHQTRIVPTTTTNKRMSLDQTDEEMIFRDEVSDEAVEAAFVAPRGLPTLMHNTYCFACPSLQSASYSANLRRCGLCGSYLSQQKLTSEPPKAL
jgi:hypothetical protein